MLEMHKKSNTFVKFENEIEVPNNQVYEVIGTIDHMQIPLKRTLCNTPKEGFWSMDAF